MYTVLSYYNLIHFYEFATDRNPTSAELMLKHSSSGVLRVIELKRKIVLLFVCLFGVFWSHWRIFNHTITDEGLQISLNKFDCNILTPAWFCSHEISCQG